MHITVDVKDKIRTLMKVQKTQGRTIIVLKIFSYNGSNQ